MVGRILSVLILAGFLAMLGGCAGGGVMRIVDQDYMPTHVAVGDVMAYNLSNMMKTDDLIRLFTNNLEEELYNEDVRYVPLKEIESTPVDHQATILIDLEIQFMKSSRMSTGVEEDDEDMSGKPVDVMVTYTLRRRADDMIWKDGSVRASDMPNSESALFDRTTGIQFAAAAVVAKMAELIEE